MLQIPLSPLKHMQSYAQKKFPAFLEKVDKSNPQKVAENPPGMAPVIDRPLVFSPMPRRIPLVLESVFRMRFGQFVDFLDFLPSISNR